MSRFSKSSSYPFALVPVLILALAAWPALAEAAPVLPVEAPFVLPVPADQAGHTAPAVALRPDGGLVSVWTDLDAGVVGRWIGPPEAGGVSESGMFSIGDGAPASAFDSPVLARGADGNYLAVWRRLVGGEEGLVARAFDGQGGMLASAQPVAEGRSPAFALAPRPAGGFILAWWHDSAEASEIRFRFLGPEGFPFSARIVAELAPGVNARPVRVAADSEGGFVVTWSRYLAGASLASVRARPFSSLGEALGPAFEVVPEAGSRWIEHDLAAGAPGTFVMAWTRHPGSPVAVQELYSRAFLTGGALGRTHRLDDNDDPTHPLSRPSVAMGADGDGVVAWADGDFASLRLLARLLELDGSPRSERFVVDSGPSDVDFINGIDTDRDAAGRLAFGWGLGYDSAVLPTGFETFWTSRARRFRETDPDCHPVLSLDFRTEPAAPEAGEPVRLLFEGLADCAEVSLVDWSLEGGAFEVEAMAVSQACGTFPPFPISVPVEVGALDAGDYPVTIDVDLPGGGACSRDFAFTVEPEPAEPPPPEPPPPPPASPPLTSASVPGFRVWVEITPRGGAKVTGAKEDACIPETLCVSGQVPGRSEVFVRVVGPKPNGRLWPTLVKFSTSTVEVWIEQTSTGEIEYYRLEGARPGVDELPGLFDREGFEP